MIVGAHAAGQTVGLLDGAPDFPDPGRVWRHVERARLTFVGVSPTLVRGLKAAGDGPVREADRSTLRTIGCAGEPIDGPSYRWLTDVVGESRCPIINLSGGTEVAASFLSADVAIPLEECSLGRPALGMAVEVRDPRGRRLGAGEGVGELVCTRPWPSMTRGFWGDDERYLASYWSRWPDVWLHGDWASISSDGAWFLHGRSDDAMNIAGKRIAAAEFEAALLGHWAVAEACVVALPHELKGEAAHCFVRVAGGAVPDDRLRAELLAVVEAELGKAFRPTSVRFVELLPKTRSQKIVRRVVRAVALGQDPGDVSTLEDPAALDAIGAAS